MLLLIGGKIIHDKITGKSKLHFDCSLVIPKFVESKI